jgi:hypothetical protein
MTPEQLIRRIDPIALAAIAVVAGVALGLVIAWAWKWYRARRDRLARRDAVTAIAVDYVQDMLVPDGNGGVLHVDFALLTPRGIVLVDLRDVAGNVFGSDQMAEWTLMDGAQRYTFPNPLNLLYDRVAAVRAVAGNVPVEGRIVFTQRAAFPKGLPSLTLGLASLPIEFPLGDRGVAEQAAAQYRDDWAQFKGQLSPSPLVKG